MAIRPDGGNVRGGMPPWAEAPQATDGQQLPQDDRLRTLVGSGTNKRLEDKKGPFVQTVEGLSHDLADAMVAATQALREANGPIPAFQQPLSNERIAALHLPEWFVHGNQEPNSPAAQDYWRRQYSAPNPTSPEAAGPAGANLFQKQMATLWQNPKMRAIAFASMPPDLRDELVQAVASGQHPGYAYRYKDGQRVKVEEQGSIEDHLTAVRQADHLKPHPAAGGPNGNH